jgi:hypothetical protein
MVTSAPLAAVTATVSASPRPAQTSWILDPGVPDRRTAVAIAFGSKEERQLATIDAARASFIDEVVTRPS